MYLSDTTRNFNTMTVIILVAAMYFLHNVPRLVHRSNLFKVFELLERMRIHLSTFFIY